MEVDGSCWQRGSLIGRGAFGSVFLARRIDYYSHDDDHLPRLFAVKTANLLKASSIHSEFKTLINLQDSPYIIRCYGEEVTASNDGHSALNLLLEYAAGGSLSCYIKESVGLPEPQVKWYTNHIVLGLYHIHKSGYVHCDLKPDNVLLVHNHDISSGRFDKYVAKIADFGLAKKRLSDPYMRGSTMYMAPETIVDGVQESCSDIWALGCLVLEMLTGNPPWDGDNFSTLEFLSNIGNLWDHPIIPDWISGEARSFLELCFVRKARFRATAEKLLNHPFLSNEVTKKKSLIIRLKLR